MIDTRANSRGTLRMVALLTIGLLGGFATPASSDAGPLLDWLFPKRKQQVTYYAPAGSTAPVAGYAGDSAVKPGGTHAALPTGSCGAGTCYETVLRYLPQTSYRTVWAPVPVTQYRTTTSTNPNTGLPITCSRPCTSYTWQARRVPYTAYRPVYQQVKLDSDPQYTGGSLAGTSYSGAQVAGMAPILDGTSRERRFRPFARLFGRRENDQSQYRKLPLAGAPHVGLAPTRAGYGTLPFIPSNSVNYTMQPYAAPSVAAGYGPANCGCGMPSSGIAPSGYYGTTQVPGASVNPDLVGSGRVDSPYASPWETVPQTPSIPASPIDSGQGSPHDADLDRPRLPASEFPGGATSGYYRGDSAIDAVPTTPDTGPNESTNGHFDLGNPSGTNTTSPSSNLRAIPDFGRGVPPLIPNSPRQDQTAMTTLPSDATGQHVRPSRRAIPIVWVARQPAAVPEMPRDKSVTMPSEPTEHLLGGRGTATPPRHRHDLAPRQDAGWHAPRR